MMKSLAIYISRQTLLNARELRAFKILEERRYRTNELYESNLKISRSRIIQVPEKAVSSTAGAQSVAGPPVEGT